MKFLQLICCVVLLSALVGAHSGVNNAAIAHLIEPRDIILNDESPAFELGSVGPGQTIVLKFLRDSGSPAPINPTTGKNALWDEAKVVRETLPAGWVAKDSLLYESPLTVFVTVSPNATERDYQFSVNFSDDYEGLKPMEVKFKVKPSYDVLDVSLDKEVVTAGVSQPAVYVFNIKSKSSAPDTFVIRAKGLPYDWTFSKTFLLAHNEEQTIYYEVVGNIQKEIPFAFEIASLSSANLNRTVEAKVVTTASLLQDAKATSLGLPLFPSIEQHVYALIGFITNFFLS